jgi:putative hemolysin
MDNPLFFLIFLIGASFLNGVSAALNRLGKSSFEEIFEHHRILGLLHRYFRLFCQEKAREGLFFSLSFTKQVLQLCYALAFFFFLLHHQPFSSAFQETGKAWDLLWVLLITAVIVATSLFMNFFMNLLSLAAPKRFLAIVGPIAFLPLVIFSFVTLPLFKILELFLPKKTHLQKFGPEFDMGDKVIELLEDSDLAPYFDESDQKLLSSVVSFKERIAREVMVPRIDLFSLPVDTTLQEATESFLAQGYSRIPVYRDSVDNIIGVLLFKDALKQFAQVISSPSGTQKLTNTIENFLKPVLYTPETKKISQLLQEFRSKQIHLAIVVDEWGGTEGIITIEDILEELVGEIADEYDIDEEVMFSVLPGGGWIVDGKMGILDIEEDLGIEIPQGPEYETIGGYIVHRAGTIPSKGWRIHHDEFDLEVLSSDERSVDKIRITPHKPL